jgi:hypothetical protein
MQEIRKVEKKVGRDSGNQGGRAVVKEDGRLSGRQAG